MFICRFYSFHVLEPNRNDIRLPHVCMAGQHLTQPYNSAPKVTRREALHHTVYTARLHTGSLLPHDLKSNTYQITIKEPTWSVQTGSNTCHPSMRARARTHTQVRLHVVHAPYARTAVSLTRKHITLPIL